MAKVNFLRRETTAEVDNIPVTDGNFIVTKDGDTFVDYGTERVALKGEVTIDSEMSDTSENPVQNKVVKSYVDAADTKKLDKTSVKGTKTTSDEATYSCNYVNNIVTQNNIILVQKTESTLLSSTDYTSIGDWAEKIKIGTKLSFTNDKIKIGAGVSKVKITANIAFYCTQADVDCNIYLEKNENHGTSAGAHTQAMASFDTNIEWATSIYTDIIEVTENDTICIGVQATLKNELYVTAGCILIVEVVE